ncbi:hypothetical protein ACNR9Q_10010 [Maribacter sp. X9]|uniref:hypothetical protein n=1 Tax=Maribacter sp. X9 TaxID=3402159 RepID=UPI003AF3863B
MNTNVIGYGSFFHQVEPNLFGSLANTDFCDDRILFYSGRHAIKYIILLLKKTEAIETVWFPNYYCPFVKEWLEHEFETIKYYEIDPFDPKATIDWSNFKNKNAILFVNNYWGLKTNPIPDQERPWVIEDHSHGWLSEGCENSTADFCIASLRKTIPLPLGGIAWKPKKSRSKIALASLNLPYVDEAEKIAIREAWDSIGEAMRLKATCEEAMVKDNYLQLHAKGESKLGVNYSIVPVLEQHKIRLEEFLFKDYNHFKNRNLAYTVPKIEPSPFFKIINTESFDGFGLLLVFKEEACLKKLKSFLISKAIYPAELWPKNTMATAYKFLLNIHMDFRYTPENLNYIIEAVNNGLEKTTPHDL